MSLNGIDTASYQAGLDPAKVPMDFNIVKATQGTTYINPDFKRMANATLDAGHLLGVYHYASGGDAKAEADFFLKVAADYIGKAILCLDWEKDQNAKFGKSDVDWCKTFCDRVFEKTGIRCFVYMSKSVCHAHYWGPVAKEYPLWCAQYATMGRTGYQEDPWTDQNGWGAWDSPAIFQYSSGGQLSGWSGRLDLDKAYMTADEWLAYAGQEPQELPFPEKTDTDLAVEVWYNVYGNGAKRRQALGSRYTQVQKAVSLLGEDVSDFVSASKAYLEKFGCDKLV